MHTILSGAHPFRARLTNLVSQSRGPRMRTSRMSKQPSGYVQDQPDDLTINIKVSGRVRAPARGGIVTKHVVKLTTGGVTVGNVDVCFNVKKGDKETLGDLGVSLGGLAWRPKNRHRKSPIAISWEAFDQWAKTQA